MNSKIESVIDEGENNNTNNIKMKPTYSSNTELMCGVINYNGKTYYVDYREKDRIINFEKKFVFVNDDDIYPSYCSNYKRYTYLEFIFHVNTETVHYTFKNGNIYDLRQSNVRISHFYAKNIEATYNVLEYKEGHYYTLGQHAGVMKNPMWRILEDDKEYILMYCEKDTICKLCHESYQKILDYETENNNGKKMTWFKHLNGYILSSGNLFIHQVITGCYGNGKGTKVISVDHIDRDPLNNTMTNLRIATRKEQEPNTKGIMEATKRARKTSAIALPEGITQEMMRKYVVYYHEWLDKDRTRSREFFKVEKHPKLDKIWCTTKSGKITIQSKLDAANKVVDDLNENIQPLKSEATLPKYVSLIIARDKPHLVFEKRILNGKRLNIKMVLPEEYDLDEQLDKLNEKVKAKYEGETIIMIEEA